MELSKSIKKFIFITAFSSILLAFFTSILFQYNSFNSDLNHLKKEFTEQKKREAKNEVMMITSLIEYKEKLLVKNLNDKLKARVNQAYTIAMNIYNENISIKSEDEIKFLIAKALKDLRFKDDNNYFFINSNKGQAILFNKELFFDSYFDIWNLKDIKNRPVIQDQSKIALEQNEGFTIHSFIKPDVKDKTQYSKLSYIKLFEPFDWHIGMGEYLDELRKKNKEELLNWISTLKYENSGYTFVNSIDGNSLIFEGKKLDKPKTHPYPIILQQQLETSKNLDGDFFEYKFKKPNSIEEFEKISFVKRYGEYGWIIGCGVYLDEINAEIKKKELIFKQNIQKQLTSIFGIFLLILIAIYFISKKMSNFINTNIENLIQAFTKASLENKNIDTEKLTYKEFVTLGNSLNKTLEVKNCLEKELKKLSITDELTQLFNRRFFNLKIEEEINRAKRENKYLCLIILDIDYFKQYNDTYGHQKGDIVLQEVTKVLKSRTNRASDFAFRIGGEEFAIITNLEKEKIEQFIYSIKNDIENLKIEHKSSKVSSYITSSFGALCKLGENIKNSDEFYKEADDNLYEAKKLGRNTICIK
ncbi:multi-sensor domain-containing diguanylate cyclase [Aliarcobacter faecis]|uniref:sensor domain-containing diguanylate cyclase n=1 Tax=Aliarcobacter faecis TaxID=1564138 RepID=UPI0004797398|nr:cache domain-containing protein [Aliarcobacter faecis]QKF73611.1 multi-sensor domain-containing diguanylate cyclase [Aliarcobacter faecis]